MRFSSSTIDVQALYLKIIIAISMNLFEEQGEQ
jgi:hypothetical protein